MFTLTVTAEEINIIGAGLGELPLKVSGPLAARLQAQVDEQENRGSKKPKSVWDSNQTEPATKDIVEENPNGCL